MKVLLPTADWLNLTIKYSERHPGMSFSPNQTVHAWWDILALGPGPEDNRGIKAAFR